MSHRTRTDWGEGFLSHPASIRGSGWARVMLEDENRAFESEISGEINGMFKVSVKHPPGHVHLIKIPRPRC